MKKTFWNEIRVRGTAVGVTLLVLTCIFNGCSQNSIPAATKPASSSSVSVSSAAGDSISSARTRTITDMMGKVVTVPKKIQRVYCSSPIGTDFLYTLAPDKLLGWNSVLTESEKTYIAAPYKNLPVLGGTMGGQNSINTESVIKLKPDIILDFEHEGQISQDIQKLSEQTGIPIVEAAYDLDKTEQCYRFLGDVLGQKKRGDQLADYVRDSLAQTKKACAKVPDSQKIKIYYSESADGLKTDGTDSMHTEVISYVNAVNVVNMKTAAMAKGTSVSMEQVLTWNPDVILINTQMGGTKFLKSVYTDSKWKDISAVKNRRIYSPVNVPFNWFDRPPCIARVLGVEWLANVLYPKTVAIDLKSEIKKFYELFYQVSVTDKQAQSLLKASGVLS